ncbi:MAG: ArnT family glycosyltransferase [Ktedonobacteraceae bacterium]
MIPLPKITRQVNNKKYPPGQVETGLRTTSYPRVSEWLILPGLALVALIPRLILARQLDLVTDEIIYIMGGKGYLPLLLHLQITSNVWDFNYEHPPVVKLLIGLAIYLNRHFGGRFSVLFAARTPSIVSGTLLVVAIYWLGRAPFGRASALLAALCLAVSPWLVYFSALAYLDMTMTMLISLAYLLLWPAIRQPRLYVLSAIFVGLGVASKYTAALVIPGMILFTAYYFIAIRPKLPADQRPSVPWLWWLGALIMLPATFFIADPAIWRHPYSLLIQSVLFEWQHSLTGHLTFLAGQYSGHVPHWAVLYIVLAKLSAFVTLPAVFFLIFSIVQLLRFHLNKSNLQVTEVSRISFLLIWLVSLVGTFSLLNIVVGTHYLLPLAPPVVLAGAFGLTTLLRYRGGTLFQASAASTPTPKIAEAGSSATPMRPRIQRRSAIVLAVLMILFVGPHVVGLTTVYAAEGYTSEFFNGENTVLQVAYPGYREAGRWLVTHTSTAANVGLVALPGTLNHGDYSISWYSYNRNIAGRLKFSEAHPDDANLPYDYLVWPMHLVQRGYAIPAAWRSHIVHTIMGGNTIYCFILARNPATI